LIEAGDLQRIDRVELLEGVVRPMNPQNRAHALFVMRLSRLLQEQCPKHLRVRCQTPMTLSDHSEPEPDLAVVTADEEDTAPRHPRTALLIVESSLHSLRRDRTRKARLYARAGVPEYWVADLQRRRVHVYTEPNVAEGRYVNERVVEDEPLSPSCVPGVQVRLAKLMA
ncbi:MAG TPA: Uma2 family endonuclease, partial [Myxococcaceae bacterium]|nr:Uma2 family endonuclease [Myxococcaceae bacterium]